MKTSKENLSDRVKNGRNGMQYTYLIDCIKDSSSVRDGYAVVESDRDALKLFFDSFNTQYNYEDNKRRIPNLQERIAEWLQGLPDTCAIDYRYGDMVELGIKWGVLKEREGRKAEKFISNFYKMIALRALQAGEKLGIDPFKYA